MRATQLCVRVTHCNTLCLWLSWLASYSDEDGNIRRMIYDDDLFLLCFTATLYLDSADFPAPQQQAKQLTFNSNKEPQIIH